MNRRDLLKILALIPVTLGAKEVFKAVTKKDIKANLNYVGMKQGHAIRDAKFQPENIEMGGIFDVLIIGSGIAALTAAWKLVSGGYSGKIGMILGPEKFGNSSDIEINNKFYPTGAHYLPIQNEETYHTKEILKFFNIITDGHDTKEPTYNDEYLVTSPMERVLFNKEWHEGIYQKNEVVEKFFAEIEKYKNKIGKDNKKLFSIPSVFSSSDLDELDSISFKDWLIKNNFKDKVLEEHLNYCCKDDYGVDIEKTSAWAGIHYFAGRTGECKNMKHETIMTWKNGNAFLSKKIFDYIKNKVEIIDGSVLNINKDKELLVIENNGVAKKIKAEKLILSTPLHMINYLFKETIISKELIPNHAIWVVSNFLFKELPTDIYQGCDIAYDNIIQESDNLGYIYSDNLGLDISMENKVLTTYFCMPSDNLKDARRNLLKMSKEEYLDLAMKDLIHAYGEKVFNLISSVEVNIRAHAMSFPEVGFKSRRNKLINEMRKIEKNGIYFAHSDISSISIFEEASWWGYSAAKNIMKLKH